MADDKKSDLDKFGVRGILEQASQGTLASTHKVFNGDEVVRVWGKDKAKNFKIMRASEVVSGQQPGTAQSNSSIDGERELDIEQHERLKSFSPDAFSGDELEYSQLQVLIDKHPRRTIVEVYRRFVLQPTFAAFLLKVFAEGGWRFLRMKFAKNHQLGKNTHDQPLDEPANGPANGEPVPLEGLDDQIVIDYVARSAAADPQFASRFQAAFAKAKNPAVELPTSAPKLWADNMEGLPATAFVAKHYSPWIEAGALSLKAIRARDPDLAKAYRNRVSRYPSEAIALVRSTRSDRIEDPQEAIDRVRDAARESAARRRAASRDDPTNALG